MGDPIRSTRDADEIATLRAENERLEQWVSDCQAGMYINCVYCGHRYGPDSEVPAAMADVLKEHIEQCPKHPMSALRADYERLREAHEYIIDWCEAYPVSVFPEPDFKKAASVLKAAGMTLDAISASNFRHCLKGVGKISRAALAQKEKKDAKETSG